jgi:hypothetical protein
MGTNATGNSRSSCEQKSTGTGRSLLGIVAGHELRRGERGEDQLALEAQQVERPAALGRIEGAQRVPALEVHELALELGQRGVVELALLGLVQGVVGQLPGRPQVEPTEPVAELGLDVALEPVVELHDVAVGVVEGAPLGVRHRLPPPD